MAYQGQSPDEITLLDTAKEVGILFKDRTSGTVTLDVFGKERVFNLLNKIEFSSDRKKMTVIVEDPIRKAIIVYTKGADFAIFERLSKDLE